MPSQTSAHRREQRRFGERNHEMKKNSIWTVLLLAAMLLNFAFAEDVLPTPEAAADIAEPAAEAPAQTAEETSSEEASAEETAQEPVKTVHIRAVGDLMASRHQLKLAGRSGDGYDYAPQFQHVRDALANADFTIANLETVVDPDQPYTETNFPNFNTPPAFLDALKDCGIDFLSLANNHMNDSNFPGVAATVRQVRDHGFTYAGAYAHVDDLNKPVVAEVNGIKIGFLCYTTLINRPPKKQYRQCIATTSNRNVLDDVAALKNENVDIIICMIHWGEEKNPKVVSKQYKYAEALVNAGVDVIIGSHPHLLQPVEVKTMEINGEQRRILIAWSLGNFIGEMRDAGAQNSIILDFSIVKENGKTAVGDVGYIPTYTLNRTDYVMTVPTASYTGERLDYISDKDYQNLCSGYEKTTKMLAEFQLLEE